MPSGNNALADRAWSGVDWFIREGAYWRRHQRVEEAPWKPAELRRTFKAAVLDRIRAWDAVPFFQTVSDSRPTGRQVPLIAPGCRTFYLAPKSRSRPALREPGPPYSSRRNTGAVAANAAASCATTTQKVRCGARGNHLTA